MIYGYVMATELIYFDKTFGCQDLQKKTFKILTLYYLVCTIDLDDSQLLKL